MDSPPTLLELAGRVERGSGLSNALDIEIEMALFNPSNGTIATVRKNAASSKLIYTCHDGREITCWAGNWSMDRPRAVELLRARHAAQTPTEDTQHHV